MYNKIIVVCMLDFVNNLTNRLYLDMRGWNNYQSFIYSPTDALLNCLKNNIKIHIKPQCLLMATCHKTPHSSNWYHCHPIFTATGHWQLHCKQQCCDNFHIRPTHLDIIKVSFIHKLMHQWVVLKKNNIKINIKIYVKIAPTCFGVAVTPSSGSVLIRAY